jgi:hypothetical protein
MSSMQREAHRMKPDLAMASSKRLEAMLEGTNVGGGQLVGRGSSSVMNIDYQSPRQSELAVISRMLSSQCGKGAVHAVLAPVYPHPHPPPHLKKALRRQPGECALMNVTHMAPSLAEHGRMISR